MAKCPICGNDLKVMPDYSFARCPECYFMKQKFVKDNETIYIYGALGWSVESPEKLTDDEIRVKFKEHEAEKKESENHANT